MAEVRKPLEDDFSPGSGDWGEESYEVCEVMDCSRLVEGIGGSTMVIGTRRRFGGASWSRVDLLASRLSSFYVKFFSVRIRA